MANPIFTSATLTLQNYKPEITKAVEAVQRHRIEQLGRQFTVWRNDEARDADREAAVRMLICILRGGGKPKGFW